MYSESVLHLSWTSVVQRFSLSFDAVFSSNKKAHFDCLPQAYKVIDGARARWRNLLLLDAVIYFLTASDFVFVSRRAFNQQRVLYESIMEEVKGLDKHLHRDVVINRAVVIESKFQICKLEYPWDSVNNLKHFLLHDPPAKSKQRYLSIIDLLCDSSPLADRSLESLFLAVLYKVLGLTNVYQQQLALGNCPKSANKLDSFKNTGFYKECSAMADSRAVINTKTRPARHADRSSPMSDSFLNDNDSDEDYEESVSKRRHSTDNYRRKSRRVSVKVTHSNYNYYGSDVLMDDEETIHDDSVGGCSSSTAHFVAGMASAPQSMPIEETNLLQQLSMHEGGLDLADCLAPFLKSTDSMETLDLFDDSMDF